MTERRLLASPDVGYSQQVRYAALAKGEIVLQRNGDYEFLETLIDCAERMQADPLAVRVLSRSSAQIIDCLITALHHERRRRREANMRLPFLAAEAQEE